MTFHVMPGSESRKCLVEFHGKKAMPPIKPSGTPADPAPDPYPYDFEANGPELSAEDDARLDELRAERFAREERESQGK